MNVVKAKSSANLTTNAVPASCASEVTPSCLQALYGIPTAKATQSSNKLTVSGFIEQYVTRASLPFERSSLIEYFLPNRYANQADLAVSLRSFDS